ncbi:MAG: tetratricopeptide repeat protein, partial [Thermoanaerobaculia bacterium]|nr:tetratricopeptide repeat protein [Thermoanaerobaculia bacterium]
MRRLAPIVIALVLAVPSAAGARELPSLDLEALEPAVAEQIAALDELARARLADEGQPAAERAQAVGELGQLYHAYDLRAAAADCYELAAELAPADFRWPYLLGYVRQAEGRLEEAAKLYEKALAILPGVRPALVRLGQVYAGLGRLEAAERNLREAARSDPSGAAARAELGELYLSPGRPAAAAEALREALAIEPSANRLYYPLAMALRALGEEEEARRLLGLVGKVGVKPADPLIDGLAGLTTGARVRLLRGRAAYGAGRFREAAEEFARAVEADGNSIPARVNLGSALAALGENEAAAEQFRWVVEAAPANLAALYNLGSLAAAAGDHEAALTW